MQMSDEGPRLFIEMMAVSIPSGKLNWKNLGAEGVTSKLTVESIPT